MANTSEFSRQVVPLQGGLELAGAKFEANGGQLSKCLNFEVSDVRGYSRIDGISRYDGETYDDRSTQVYTMVLIGTLSDGNVAVGDDVDIVASKVAEVAGFYRDPSRVEGNDLLWITPTASTTGIVTTLNIGAGGTKFRCVSACTAEQHYLDTRIAANKSPNHRIFRDVSNLLQQGYNAKREPVFPPVNTTPAQITPHGMFWYRDQLYAIVDHYVIKFDRGNVKVYPGDRIKFESDREAEVIDVSSTTGEWGAAELVDRAAGYMMIRFLDGYPNANTLTDATELVSLIRGVNVPDESSPPDAFRLVSFRESIADQAAWGAGIYVAADTRIQGDREAPATPVKRWYAIDMGWQVSVKDVDTSASDIPVAFRGEVGDTFFVRSSDGFDDAGTQVGGFGNAIDNDTSTFVTAPTNWLTGTLTNFALEIPEGAIITGIEVEVLASNGPQTADPDPLAGGVDIRLVGAGDETGGYILARTAEVLAAAPAEIVGAPDDLWGRPEITREQVTATGFGIRVSISSGTLTTALLLRTIKLKVHFRRPTKEVYFWNGIDDVTADIVNIHITEGDTTLGTGEGRFYLYDIKPFGASKRWIVSTGDEVRTEAAGGGEILAVCAASPRVNTLPTASEMIAARNQFVTVNANFYAVDGWDGIYGASGIGRAFAFDSFYYSEIYGAAPTELDNPRHVEFHASHLFLGYASGVLRSSVVGEPTNFSGLDGAAEFGMGDRITGIQSLSGETLAIFCKSSIRSILGNTSDNFTQRVISADNGCIEYSLVNMGQPLFLDYRGVCSLEASDKYGDFTWGRFSDPVYPLIRSRVQGRRTQSLNPVNFVSAVAVRNKNQYRMYFEDGLILTMTLSQGFNAEFTTQRYASYALTEFSPDGDSPADRNGYVPLAICSGVNSTATGADRGRDRVFATFRGPYQDVLPADPEAATPGDTRLYEARLDHVFEVDTSNFIDDQYLYAYFETDHNSFGDVFVEKAIQRVDAQMLWDGSMSVRINGGSDFASALDRTTNTSVTRLGVTKLVRSGEAASPTTTNRPVSLMSDFKKTGVTVTLLFECLPPSTVYSMGATDGSNPFTVQALAIQLKPAKGDR